MIFAAKKQCFSCGRPGEGAALSCLDGNSFTKEFGEQIEVVVIAQDAQGAEVASPWIKKAGGTYRALLDQHNEIGKAYNVKFVPVGIFVDEEGRLARAVGSVNIGNRTLREELVEWITSGAVPSAGAMQIKGQNPAH